ncbi:MAG: prohibitin family protein [Bacillota bacterium]|nr:prohibitin family protein [Bacillota bacterium]
MNRHYLSSNFVMGAIITAVVLLGGAVLIGMSTTKIQPGYAGVIYGMDGGIKSRTLSQGWHLISPTEHVTSYPVSTETVFLSKDSKEGSKEDDSFDINTKSGKSVNVDASYSYHMDSNKLPEIFTKFRGQDAKTIEDNFIRRSLKSNINNISSGYEVMDVYGASRPEIQSKVMDAFAKDMQQYGITIESFTFLAIRPDSASMQAIQDKVNAEQKLQTAKVLQEQAKVDAETKRVTAQGDADAALIKAQGEAKANEAVKQSLTPELVEYTKWTKWDGKLPTTMTGDNSLINIPASSSAATAGK